MGSTNCMNEVCRATVSSEWKKGWGLKSRGSATLCYNCGSAYENSVFCETFHSDESGWRECKMCRKRIHCGCIASRYLHEYMDFGGVGCVSCVKRLEMQSVQPMQILGDVPNGTNVTNGIRDNGTRDLRPIIENKMQDDRFSTERLLQLTKVIQANDVNSFHEQPKRDDFMLRTGESSKKFPNFTQPYTPSSFLRERGRPKQGVKNMYESPAKPSLNYSLINNSSSAEQPFSVGVAEKGEQNKGSSQQGQRARHILPKPVKPSPVEVSENNTTNNSNNNNTNNSNSNNQASVSQPRVARAPAEGRGRNQLLPRYWPKITDQELLEISGDLKSPITPLFEKILSASDAGRIGRLVLPKACAEAYFPAINQSEGIPIRIQDIKGKEWQFQFRFWPNNNSRMYVLEGVTPCIQTMQLQAGDIVTFSRIDPGGQLVIGCRKATSADAQDSQVSYIPNGDSTAEASFSAAIENVQTNGGKTSDHISISEKKKARNMKNKRLLMHSEDVMEVRVTWEEALELLRPSPDSEPAVMIVEEHEFEEFQEPPVFGKRTIFTSRPSGEQEQLAQCDTCSKWRRLPANALLSAKWTCSENIWDSNRSSCSAPDDINPRDLEFYFGMNKDFKQRRISENMLPIECEPSGLDALATAAVLGDNIEISESSMGATTRHPRHRPGCTCIVCIQPPSGKGKHEPTCKCNVCLTVKRRFKTLMMRKKKRQSEREAELAQKKDELVLAANVTLEGDNVALDGDDIAGVALLDIKNMDNEINGEEMDLEEAEKVGLDLNCDPHRENDILAEAAGMNLTTLMNAATLPAEMFVEENEVPAVEPCLVSDNGADGEKGVGDRGSMEGDVKPESNRKGG